MLTGRPLAQRRAPLHLKDTVLGYDLKGKSMSLKSQLN